MAKRRQTSKGEQAVKLELAAARATMAGNEAEVERIHRELESLLNTTDMPSFIA